MTHLYKILAMPYNNHRASAIEKPFSETPVNLCDPKTIFIEKIIMPFLLFMAIMVLLKIYM